MLTKTEGVVLHSIKHGDSGRIIKIYTKERGLIPFFVRSTRSKKNGDSSGHYLSLRILSIEADIRENRALQTIRQVTPIQGQLGLYNSPVRASLALFIAEVFLKSIEEEEHSTDLYQRLLTWTNRLETATDLVDLPIHFLIDLSDPLGFQPHSETSGEFFDLREGLFTPHPPPHKEFLDTDISSSLRTYLGTGFVADSPPLATREKRKRLMEGLIDYYRVHIPQFNGSNAFQVLSEVFSI